MLAQFATVALAVGVGIGVVKYDMMYQLRSISFSLKGLNYYTKSGYLKASASFDPHALDVDMVGKTVIVTGANTGIGFAVAEQLALRRAEVHMLCRSASRGKTAVDKIKRNYKQKRSWIREKMNGKESHDSDENNADEDDEANVHLHEVDMSSIGSIKSFVAMWKNSNRPIHVLVNNAGCMVHHKNVPDDTKSTGSQQSEKYQAAARVTPIPAPQENTEQQSNKENDTAGDKPKENKEKDKEAAPLPRWNSGSRENFMSAEGYEINFATNTLGTYALTRLLEPVLAETASGIEKNSNNTESKTSVRVITVSSGGMLTEPLEVADLEGKSMRPFDAIKQYAKDKRRQVALMELFAARYNDNNSTGTLKFFSMHPGWSETDGLKRSLTSFDQQFQGRLRDWQQGADTIVWLACVEETPHKKNDSKKNKGVVLQTGEFYFDRQTEKKWTFLDFGATRYSLKDVEKLEEKLKKMAEIN